MVRPSWARLAADWCSEAERSSRTCLRARAWTWAGGGGSGLRFSTPCLQVAGQCSDLRGRGGRRVHSRKPATHMPDLNKICHAYAGSMSDLCRIYGSSGSALFAVLSPPSPAAASCQIYGSSGSAPFTVPLPPSPAAASGRPQLSRPWPMKMTMSRHCHSPQHSRP